VFVYLAEVFLFPELTEDYMHENHKLQSHDELENEKMQLCFLKITLRNRIPF
jgi:hypothetical protein